jgi:trk system potassium uptake protein TrkH
MAVLPDYMRMDRSFVDKLFSRPERMLVGTFLGMILLGMILLSLPWARTDGHFHPFDAAFTSTSAVCVTGLIVCDTATDFTRFGQVVILILIQFGGLGIMTAASLVMQVARIKLSLGSQAALGDMYFHKETATRYRRSVKWIVLLTLIIEAIGALLLYRTMPDGGKQPGAAFTSLFHSVSAFCNAGFSTWSDSLTSVRHNVGFMSVITVLIILGGLGYTVLLELISRGWKRLRRKKTPIAMSLNTRVVLLTSLVLIVAGALFLDFEDFRTFGPGWFNRTGDDLFQSITARTAGFNTVDIGALSIPALLWLTFLMFVGGSPGSCAGGVKTTTLAIWLARLRARLRHREDVTIVGRRIPTDLMRRAALLLGVSVLYNLVGILILAITETNDPDIRLEQLVFEQISAFATVGLSTGITPTLTAVGKCWIMLTMFIGRLGPLTMMLVVIDHKPDTVRLPEERLMIG